MDGMEKQWLDEYRAGSVEALGRLVEHTRRPLYGFISKMMQGHADADEIFQEVWVRAMRSLDRYKDDRFLSWLFRIAHNLVIDRARKTNRLTSFDQAATEEGQPLSERLAESGPGPAQRLLSEDLQSEIAAAVARLPPEQREVFLLRTEGEVPFKEIARLQGVSINTALARMQYAVRKLRYELRDCAPGGPGSEP
jgi:RNA polymerase sigma-70 factor, ECF subfamily